jgi:hypothetical protein
MPKVRQRKNKLAISLAARAARVAQLADISVSRTIAFLFKGQSSQQVGAVIMPPDDFVEQKRFGRSQLENLPRATTKQTVAVWVGHVNFAATQTGDEIIMAKTAATMAAHRSTMGATRNTSTNFIFRPSIRGAVSALRSCRFARSLRSALPVRNGAAPGDGRKNAMRCNPQCLFWRVRAGDEEQGTGASRKMDFT